jgi:CHAT domain-containing protein
MLAAPSSPVDVALGGSIVVEELKGAPGEASRLAAAAMERARAGGAAVVADALVDHGRALLVAGRPAAARGALLEAMELGPPVRALAAGALERVATAWCFNTFPDGQGAAATEIAARWDGVADEAATVPRLDALAGQVADPAVHLLRELTGLLSALGPITNALELARFLPNAPEGMLDTLLPTLLRFENSPSAAPGAWVAFGRLVAARACRLAGAGARADALLDDALRAYREAADRAGEGLCHLTAGDWLSAPFSSPLSWNLALRDSAGESSELDWRLEAVEFAQQGADLDGARVAYTRAEAAFAEASAPRGLAALRLRRDYLAFLAGDHEAVAAHAAAAHDGFASAGDLAGAHLAALHVALARIGAGTLAEDRDAAAAAGSWGARDGSFSLALGMGLLCGRVGRHWRLRHGDSERALACYRLAGVVFESLGAPLNAAQSLVDQADVLAGVGDPAGGGALREAAIERNLTAVDDSPVRTEVAQRRGLLLAVGVLQDAHARRDAAAMERALRRVDEALARPPAPDDPQEQAIRALAAWLGSQMGTAIPLARAMDLREQGGAEDAGPLFMAAQAAAAQASADQRHLLEASVLASQERFAEAREAYREHVAAREGDGHAAALARILGPEQVERARAQAVGQDFAFLTRVRAWADAHAAAHTLATLRGPDWWAEDERPWAVLSDLGEVLEGLGRLDEALGWYEQAMDTFEARRDLLGSQGLRTSLAASRDAQWAYFLATRCALRRADEDPPAAPHARARAFAYAERGKARALLDMMARSAARAAGQQREPPERRRWRELGARADIAAQLLARRRADDASPTEIDELERRLASEQAELRAVEAELAARDPQWLGGVRAGGEVGSLDDVAAGLPPRTALLQWSFLGRDLLAWAITSDGMLAHVRSEVDARLLGRTVRELRTACESRAPDWERHAEVLAGPLLDPFADVLATYEQLIVVPYGVAHELPVHLLPWDGAPIGLSHVISALPSASVLRYAQGRSGRPWRVLAVGNPTGMSYRAPGAAVATPAEPLQGAEAEAAAAAAAFPGGEALLGEQATEDAVRARIADFPIVHLATHGVLDQDAPGLSCVLLANGEALSVYELAGMDLDVDLAVLSACRTGQGAATRGDDVVGLARGLLGAGCRSAVVSLWPVDDASTALVMCAFYRAMQAGRPAAAALQDAQRHLRAVSAQEAEGELGQLGDAVPEGARDMLTGLGGPPATGYDHPYYWAPFALVGEGTIAREDP